MAYIDDYEKNRLNKMSRDLIKTLDPLDILDRLGFNPKERRGGNGYVFNMRGEDTPSAFMTLMRSGEWVYKDFGSGEKGGSIIKLVENYQKCTFEQAMEYIYANLRGARNFYEEALGYELEKKYSYENDNNLLELQKRKEENQRTAEKYNTDSKVTHAFGISNPEKVKEDISKFEKDGKEIPLYLKTSQESIDFLNNRGIDIVPPFIMSLRGEYETIKEIDDKEEVVVKKTRGIGVLTGNIKEHKKILFDKKALPDDIGGDAHYYKAFTNSLGKTQKTISFGIKMPSYWFSEKNKDTVLIFESKFDASAMYCYEYNNGRNIWKDNNVIIANGVGTAKEVAKFIIEQGYKNIINYSQNDFAALLFANEILEEMPESFDKETNYTYVKYEQDEYKMDINDLYKDGKYSEDRLDKGYSHQLNGVLEYMKKMVVEKRNQLSMNTVKESEKEVDNLILDIYGVSKDNKIEEKLTTDEYRRYSKLMENGFLKNLENKKILRENLGKSIEDLILIAEMMDFEKKIEQIQNIKNIKKGEGMQKENIKTKEINEPQEKIDTIEIKNSEQFNKLLDNISVKNNNIKDLELIAEYFKKNKKNEDIKYMRKWIEKFCPKTSINDFEKARPYIKEIESVLNKNFKLINIGIELEEEKDGINNENQITKEKFIVEKDAFNTIEGIDAPLLDEKDLKALEIEEKQEEIAKEEKKEKSFSIPPEITEMARQKEEKVEVKKIEEPIKKEEKVEVKKIEEPIKKEEKVEVKKVEDFTKFENILDKYEEKIDRQAKAISRVQKTPNVIQNKEDKEKFISANKIVINTISERLNSDYFIESISNEKDEAIKNKHIESVDRIWNKMKTNNESLKKLENTEYIDNQKLNTKELNDKQILSILDNICDDIEELANKIEKTAENIMKYNQEIERLMEEGRHP